MGKTSTSMRQVLLMRGILDSNRICDTLFILTTSTLVLCMMILTHIFLILIFPKVSFISMICTRQQHWLYKIIKT